MSADRTPEGKRQIIPDPWVLTREVRKTNAKVKESTLSGGQHPSNRHPRPSKMHSRHSGDTAGVLCSESTSVNDGGGVPHVVAWLHLTLGSSLSGDQYSPAPPWVCYLEKMCSLTGTSDFRQL